MGNVIGVLATPGAAPMQRMNIPPDQAANDPNNPYSRQVIGVILNGLIPLTGICFFAYISKNHRDEKKAWKEQHDQTVAKLVNEMEQQKRVNGSDYRKDPAFRGLLLDLEKEENFVRIGKLKQLQVYDETLEKILDVRCSAFRSKDSRIRLEHILINNLTKPNSHLQGLDMFKGLNDIFNYDYLFCGRSKEQNGKFRKLYMEHWRLKVELQKYRNIVERLKTELLASK